MWRLSFTFPSRHQSDSLPHDYIVGRTASHRESMGRQPSALNAARGGVVACAASALLHVPLDVWLLILRHLPAASYAALSQVCRRLLHLVDQHAWRLLLLSLHSTISLSALAPFHREYVEHAKRTRSSRLAARSLEWFACRHAAQLRTSWNELVLEAQSIDLPAALGAKIPPAGRPRWQRGDFAIPTLAIGDTWTAVGVRRDLFVAPAPSPTSPPALEARFVLDSQAQPGTMLTPAQGRVAETTDPWHDITAIRPVDAAASRLVVGYADGSVQMLAVHSSSSVEVQRTFESMSRFEVAGVSVFSPEDGEEVWMASVSKRGQLRIHLGAESMAWQIDEDGTASPTTDTPDSQSSRSSTPRSFRSAALNNARAEGGGGTRAWSVLLRERWVAVGMTGEQAVYVYHSCAAQGWSWVNRCTSVRGCARLCLRLQPRLGIRTSHPGSSLPDSTTALCASTTHAASTSPAGGDERWMQSPC